MTTTEFEIDYWHYYLMLEEKFIHTLSYVELSKKNFKTFSDEYAHLMVVIGAELDCIFKVYCGFTPDDRKSITEYAAFVLDEWPDIKNQKVKARELEIQPFKDWNQTKAAKSLKWWDKYDKIKHSRVANKKSASLENVLHIFAALLIVEMRYFKKIADNSNQPDTVSEASKLLFLMNWPKRYISLQHVIAEATEG